MTAGCWNGTDADAYYHKLFIKTSNIRSLFMINTKITCSIIKKFSAFDAVALSRKKASATIGYTGIHKKACHRGILVRGGKPRNILPIRIYLDYTSDSDILRLLCFGEFDEGEAGCSRSSEYY